MLVYGLINSAVLAVMALGFNLTFGISGVANFAYGAIYVVSGFLTWTLINHLDLPYALSVILTIIIIGVFGGFIYKLIIRGIRGLVISEVIATLGISIVILEYIEVFYNSIRRRSVLNYLSLYGIREETYGSL
ncbi:MAG: hypothetical protein PHU49_16915 [Syntrophorhabdaceae bacterium]|nr:hypothetical protein [Syntrophorhabdaceae bacterium]